MNLKPTLNKVWGVGNQCRRYKKHHLRKQYWIRLNVLGTAAAGGIRSPGHWPRPHTRTSKRICAKERLSRGSYRIFRQEPPAGASHRGWHTSTSSTGRLQAVHARISTRSSHKGLLKIMQGPLLQDLFPRTFKRLIKICMPGPLQESHKILIKGPAKKIFMQVPPESI